MVQVYLGHAASVGKVVVQLPTGLCSCWMKSARLELLDLADVVLQSHMLEADCLLNQMVTLPTAHYPGTVLHCHCHCLSLSAQLFTAVF